jgi:thiol-disulfide isomerase/thioredoxin
MLTKIIVILVLIGGALGYTLWSQKEMEARLSATAQESLLKRLPAVQFSALEGGAKPVADMVRESGAKAVLVHFWATWCGPCEAELPEMMRFIQAQTGDVLFLLVAVNDDAVKIQKFLKQLPLPQNRKVMWVMDQTQAHRDAFGTTKLPETYLFAADGTILRKLVGPQTWENPQFFDMMKPYTP